MDSALSQFWPLVQWREQAPLLRFQRFSALPQQKPVRWRFLGSDMQRRFSAPPRKPRGCGAGNPGLEMLCQLMLPKR